MTTRTSQKPPKASQQSEPGQQQGNQQAQQQGNQQAQQQGNQQAQQQGNQQAQQQGNQQAQQQGNQQAQQQGNQQAQQQDFTENAADLDNQLNTTEIAFTQLREQLGKVPAYKRDAARKKVRALEILFEEEKKTVDRFEIARQNYEGAVPQPAQDILQAQAEGLKESRKKSTDRLSVMAKQANELSETL